jgi:hypothetical protein
VPNARDEAASALLASVLLYCQNLYKACNAMRSAHTLTNTRVSCCSTKDVHLLATATDISTVYTIRMHACSCRRLNPTRPLIVAAYCTLVCGVWAVSLAVPFWAWLLIDGAVIVAWQQIAERVKAVANTAAARGGRCASVTFVSVTFASVIPVKRNLCEHVQYEALCCTCAVFVLVFCSRLGW